MVRGRKAGHRGRLHPVLLCKVWQHGRGCQSGTGNGGDGTRSLDVIPGRCDGTAQARPGASNPESRDSQVCNCTP
ncbi:hypothetical protein BJA5080_05459 [Bradyrhizobium diazoefficiens SEMIA 5080]|uniref:Uncharacterized protein n=1 Tax=Bradyrhizobium diazoefficiens SEMIA 5080 TaxID=754504 RepID=A0A837C3C3_9BRAD|nr:hypothetical protein BJA5080_05459 [Bradyrhizobium diazoefficiens SEMIA 5080]